MTKQHPAQADCLSTTSTGAQDMHIQWTPDASFSSADRAEHALAGDHELVAFDLPPDQLGPRLIGWELFGGPKLQDLVASGEAETFADAKSAAEAAYLAACNVAPGKPEAAV